VGHLAAASGKSQPVFYGRCGILTVTRDSCSSVEIEPDSISSFWQDYEKESKAAEAQTTLQATPPHKKTQSITKEKD
jgi:hypothetical protein